MKISYTFSFPEDLERLIFEQAAADDRRTACRLALVARRVQSWVEPTIYRSIVLTSYNSPAAPFASKSPEFYRRHVKQLWMVSPPQNILTIAALCQGVTDLCLRIPSITAVLPEDVHPLDSSIGDLRPRRFSTSFAQSFQRFSAEFTRPFYSNVTHLIMADDWQRKEWPNLCLIPHLSHLMMELSMKDPGDFPGVVHSLSTHVLRDCGNLEVLVFEDSWIVTQPDRRPEDNGVLTALSKIDDARVVVFQWLNDAGNQWGSYWETTTALWPSAEAQVKRRRGLPSLKNPKDLLFQYDPA
ncbi:hypothetical protein B0H11DRAFT_2106294 [Mycena galericulata]|nr:hypothetical protein B0H11DRAFT_2106294 [Mycena galericulata]